MAAGAMRATSEAIAAMRVRLNMSRMAIAPRPTRTVTGSNARELHAGQL